MKKASARVKLVPITVTSRAKRLIAEFQAQSSLNNIRSKLSPKKKVLISKENIPVTEFQENSNIQKAKRCLFQENGDAEGK